MPEIRIVANVPARTFGVGGLTRTELEFLFMGLRRIIGQCGGTFQIGVQSLYDRMNAASRILDTGDFEPGYFLCIRDNGAYSKGEIVWKEGPEPPFPADWQRVNVTRDSDGSAVNYA